MPIPIVYHIYTDKKFIVRRSYFPDGIVVDKYIYITRYPEKENNNFCDEIFGNRKKDLQRLIQFISNGSIVILHDLDPIKAFIANRLPAKIILIWRFFGIELYQKIPKVVLSEKSLQYNLKEKMTLRQRLSKIWHSFFPRYKNEIERARKKINYFLCLSENEYNFLKNYFQLPPCLFIPRNPQILPYDVTKKKNIIIIGNSRSVFNNHLDILEMIKNGQDRIPRKYEFMLFFSYGPENDYSKAVKELALTLPNVKLLEIFLSKEDFNEIYATASSLVINGYRQMAMGNIMTALKNGIKIYLNPKNVIYSWLKQEGFYIFDVNFLLDDLANSNMMLSEEEQKYNIQQIKKLLNKYTKERLLEQLKNDFPQLFSCPSPSVQSS